MGTKSLRTRPVWLLLLGGVLLCLGRPPEGRGALLPTYEHAPSVTQSLEAPTAVAVDAEENLYVAESSRSRLLIYDPEGGLRRIIRDLGTPICLAGGKDGHLYLGNAEAGRVDVYDAEFQRAGHLGSGDGEFVQPTGIALDGDGRIYVADGKANRVAVYGADLSLKASIGGPGNGNGQFNWPLALAVDPGAGEVYVVDLPLIETDAGTGSGARVQVFDLGGHYKRSFGTYGRGDGNLTSPAAVALDASGRVYVADAFQNVVQVFAGDGAFLGSIYDLADPMRVPRGLAYSRKTSRLYVASLNLRKVDVYRARAVKYSVSIVMAGSGTVSPAGPVSLEAGGSASFQATAGQGYHLASVAIAGVELAVDVGGTFTLAQLTEDRSVVVTFEKDAVPVNWTVTASSGAHGAIEPHGAVSVADGGSQSFQLTAETGYHASEIRVDGAVVPSQAAGAYTLADVRAPHSVEVVFAADTRPGDGGNETKRAWTVIASAGANGTLQPLGTLAIEDAQSVRFALTPAAGYVVADVRVDGTSKGPVSTYLLGRVTADHTVTASFSPRPVSAVEDPTPRYVLNPDDTLTDREAGLIWLADAGCARTAGHDPGLQGAGVLTWAQALAFVKAVDQGSHPACAAGRSDWRLPNARELATLTRSDAEQQRCGEASCTSHGAWLQSLGFWNLAADSYWSSTSLADDPLEAWAAKLIDGTDNPEAKTGQGAALLVRDVAEGTKTAKTGQTRCYDERGQDEHCSGTGQDGEHQAGKAWPSPRFIDLGHGTVKDELTDLTWLKDAACLGSRDDAGWGSTLAAFNGDPSSFGCVGYDAAQTGWRLPTPEEMRSLLDFGATAPALPPSAPFLGVTTRPYWTAGAGDAEGRELGSRRAADSAAAPATASDPGVWPVREDASAPPQGGGGGGGGSGGGCFVAAAGPRGLSPPTAGGLGLVLGGLEILAALKRRQRAAQPGGVEDRSTSEGGEHHG